MGFCLGWILMLTSCLPGSLGKVTWISNEQANSEWKRFAETASPATVSRLFRSSPMMSPNYVFLPEFRQSSRDEAQIPLFEPGPGLQHLPQSVWPLFFPASTVAPPEPADQPCEALCHIDRIYVRIKRNSFHGAHAWRFIKLGKCEVNYGTLDHYYFLYLLTSDCGFSFENNVDEVTVTNTVYFQPKSRILRDLPFNISLTCNYHKYFNSYKGALRPKLLGHTLHKALRLQYRPIVITPQDEYGIEKITPYEFGDTMYFEAKLADGYPYAPNERIYINTCFITKSKVPSESLTAVIDNYGCMIDAKESGESEDSRFIYGPSPMIQRFSIKAGVLAEAGIQPDTMTLYIHCDISIADNTANPGRKACNYDSETATWTELYGFHSLCYCCDSTCLPLMGTARAASEKRITSQSLKMKTL